MIASFRIIAGSLSFSRDWSKPFMSLTGLAMPIIFVATIYLGLQAAQAYTGASIPLIGQLNLAYDIPYGGITITSQTPTQSLITQEYWTALTAGALSLIAKMVQGKPLKEASHSDNDVYVSFARNFRQARRLASH